MGGRRGAYRAVELAVIVLRPNRRFLRQRHPAVIAEECSLRIGAAAARTAFVVRIRRSALTSPRLRCTVFVLEHTVTFLLVALPVIGSPTFRTDDDVVLSGKGLAAYRALNTGIINHEHRPPKNRRPHRPGKSR